MKSPAASRGPCWVKRGSPGSAIDPQSHDGLDEASSESFASTRFAPGDLNF